MKPNTRYKKGRPMTTFIAPSTCDTTSTRIDAGKTAVAHGYDATRLRRAAALISVIAVNAAHDTVHTLHNL